MWIHQPFWRGWICTWLKWLFVFLSSLQPPCPPSSPPYKKCPPYSFPLLLTKNNIYSKGMYLEVLMLGKIFDCLCWIIRKRNHKIYDVMTFVIEKEGKSFCIFPCAISSIRLFFEIKLPLEFYVNRGCIFSSYQKPYDLGFLCLFLLWVIFLFCLLCSTNSRCRKSNSSLWICPMVYPL